MSVSRSGLGYLGAAALCWGLGAVLSKFALGGFTARSLLPLQLTCSVLLLGACLLITRTSIRGMQHPMKIGALGILNPGIAYALGLLALEEISASVSVVVWATEPVLIVVLAYWLLRERLPLGSVACLSGAMVGVIFIIGAPSGGAAPTGVAIAFSAVLACALYTVLMRLLHRTDGTLPVVFVQQASALVFASVMFLGFGEGPSEVALTRAEVASAVLAGVLYYGLAFLFFVAGLRRTSATRAGVSLTMVPVFGLSFSMILLGETIGVQQAIGSILVVASMFVLALIETRRSPRPGIRDVSRVAVRSYESTVER